MATFTEEFRSLVVTEATLPFSLCKSKIHFFHEWSCYVTFVNYIINLTVPFHWTFCLFLQLHFSAWSRGFDVTFLLCPLMIFNILFMQLELTLTVLRLKILWSLWFLGICFVTNWRNVFAAFVETDLLKGDLNHIMSHVSRFRFF